MHQVRVSVLGPPPRLLLTTLGESAVHVSNSGSDISLTKNRPRITRGTGLYLLTPASKGLGCEGGWYVTAAGSIQVRSLTSRRLSIWTPVTGTPRSLGGTARLKSARYGWQPPPNSIRLARQTSGCFGRVAFSITVYGTQSISSVSCFTCRVVNLSRIHCI